MEPPYAERHVRWCERTHEEIILMLLLDYVPAKQVGRTDHPVIQHPAFREFPQRAECCPDKADAFARHDRDGVDCQAVQQPGFNQ